MLIALCYIAEMVTLGKEVDMIDFDVELERKRVFDNSMELLKCSGEY